MKDTIARKKKGHNRAGMAGRIVLFSGSCFLLFFILCFEKESFHLISLFRVGEPAPRSFFAPLDITFLNEAETENQRKAASDAVPDVYDVDIAVNEGIRARLDDSFGILKRAQPSGDEVALENLPVNLSGSSVKVLMREDLNALEGWMKETISSFLERGTLDFSTKMELLNDGKKVIVVRNTARVAKEEVKRLRSVLTPEEVSREFEKLIEEKFSKNRRLKAVLGTLARDFLIVNLRFNENETNSRREKSYSEAPFVYEEVKKNQVVVQRGSIVTPEVYKKLQATEAKRINKVRQAKILGTGIILLLGFIILGCYLFSFEKSIFWSYRKLVLVHLLLLTVLGSERLILNIPYGFVPYLLPASVFSITLSLLLGSRLGFAGAGVISVFNALLTGFNTEVFLYSLIGSIVATYASGAIRRRVQLIKVSLYVGLTNFAVVFAVGMLHEASFRESLYMGSFGFWNGFLVSIPMVFMLLPILEHLFGIVTDITLLELSDLNHPLLRRMVIEAPGTYHHSLVVSALSEAACEAIGANSLLARVGAYFHDIGKMEKPEFFTENQVEKRVDRHGKLSPSTSYQIIVDHVKDGLELGKKFRLKEAILEFIPQHQGTCPVYFFYKKAADSPRAEERVSIDDYRYPGPKPQKKETAVVLLADSVEAASRSLDVITPGAIEELVKEIINEKFIDGQLEECDLTLEDVRKIQDSFVHNLIGILHSRVHYPKSDAEPLWQRIVGHKSDGPSRPHSTSIPQA